MDWRDDICACASQDCPDKENCVRAQVYKKPGIHTVSDFTEFCKETREYFIKESE